MVLNSEPNDAGAFDRITWSAQPDGSVRQVWEQTTDGRTLERAPAPIKWSSTRAARGCRPS